MLRKTDFNATIASQFSEQEHVYSTFETIDPPDEGANDNDPDSRRPSILAKRRRRRSRLRAH